MSMLDLVRHVRVYVEIGKTWVLGIAKLAGGYNLVMNNNARIIIPKTQKTRRVFLV